MQIYTVIKENLSILYQGTSYEAAYDTWINENGFQVLVQEDEGMPFHLLEFTFIYCEEESWKENWDKWIAFVNQFNLSNNNNIQFGYEDRGTANVCTMKVIEVDQWILKLEYHIQDDTWPSRYWNSDKTDYLDFSG